MCEHDRVPAPTREDVGDPRGRHLEPLAALDAVRQVQQPGGFVEPRHHERIRREELDQLVADQVDNRLEGELGGDALLDAVDQCELGGALLGARVGRLQIGRALGDLRFETLRELRVVECDGRLCSEHRDEIAVGVVEAAGTRRRYRCTARPAIAAGRSAAR
jgi:hypothetical protein